MSDNLIKTVEKNLGITPITKVDPNTQDVKQTTGNITTDKHTIEQAALPATLAGLYKYSRSPEGSAAILGGSSTDWVKSIFASDADNIEEHVASYAGVSRQEAYDKMENIAAEAVSVIRKNVKGPDDTVGLRDYFLSQRREILTYLPAELHAGDILGDNTLDDRTNKMEGPVSSFMQKVANLFDSTKEAPESKTHF